eukprot:gb/GFBE01033523.1/.p1 GENE.gb/GFBE01033523.1/~~gb/GFBE01033523.1/.p1  ORF type:complete len:356 (+),score=73.40 gb/GFBE01033523.1/:1-1068(+)
MPFLPGPQQVVGCYELGGFLGRGQFATVNLATHKTTGVKVAVKTIDTSKMDLLKIQQEIDNQHGLKHPNVIALHEVIETADNLLMVLEYAGAGDLFELIISRNRLPEDEARGFFQQIIAGIHFCHANNVAHRDIKPENILLDEQMNVKIADFGLSARFQEGELLTDSCGSPNYAAPELLRKNCAYKGPEVDVWACGCVLYAMITGGLPFDSEHIPQLFKMIKAGSYRTPGYVSSGAKELISQMLLVDGEQRIGTAGIQKHPWFDPTRDEEPQSPAPVQVARLMTDTALVAPAAAGSRQMPQVALLTQMLLVGCSAAAKSRSAQLLLPLSRQGSRHSCGNYMGEAAGEAIPSATAC